jgi:predicted AAA+ superfamily ATPase
MIMKRHLDISKLLEKSSYFLFGPRGTGKSYLIRNTLLGQSNSIDYIDLLNSRLFMQLQNDPSQLENLADSSTIVIDEVQRVPEILNEVHRLIEEKNKKFLLTGSSARKLRRNNTNMLAGRAYRAELFPLTWKELKDDGSFNLDKYLAIGGLPKAYIEDEGFDYLYAYIDTYLKEEIQAEALARNLINYSRFLESAAGMSSEMINFTRVANDAQLSPNTVRDYYKILEDTLLGYLLPPWTKSVKRKAIQTPKFYFADIGLVHALRNIEYLDRKSDLYGKAFEHFICNEIRAYLSYSGIRTPLYYWRSKSKFEVDFVIGGLAAIEVKAAGRVTQRDHKGLEAISEEHDWQHLIVVSQDKQAQSFGSGIRHQYWEDFLEDLWAGKIV